MSAKIAAQEPHWPPVPGHGYHAGDSGWYQSELIRRVDPKGRTIAGSSPRKIAAPLDLDFSSAAGVGDRNRMAQLQPSPFGSWCCLEHDAPDVPAAMFTRRVCLREPS